MALNPKLNVYIVTLNPKAKDTNPTYRDLFRAKYMVDTQISDSDLQEKLFQDFLNSVGKSDFRKDTKSKKVIGVSEYNDENQSCSLNIRHNRQTLWGGRTDANPKTCC